MMEQEQRKLTREEKPVLAKMFGLWRITSRSARHCPDIRAVQNAMRLANELNKRERHASKG